MIERVNEMLRLLGYDTIKTRYVVMMNGIEIASYADRKTAERYAGDCCVIVAKEN